MRKVIGDLEMEIVSRVKEAESGMKCIEGFLPFCSNSTESTITILLIFILFKLIK